MNGDGTPICSRQVVANHFLTSKDFRYTTPKLTPSVNKATKEKRYHWSKWWLIFWHSAKAIQKEVQVINAQMDEKWFYGYVSRMFQKLIPTYGITPDGVHLHNGNHIAKLMFIVVTAFAPFDNDFSKGGTSYKVCCDRVATMAVAKQTSYKWYFAEGASRYTRPQEEWNVSRRKGDQYLKSLNITGSKEGSEKNPKFSLLKWWKESHEKVLLDLCKKIEHETGKRVVLTYQWDNASPHTDGKLISYLDREIFSKTTGSSDPNHRTVRLRMCRIAVYSRPWRKRYQNDRHLKLMAKC